MKITTFLIDVGGVLARTKNIAARKRWEKKLHLKPRQLTREISKIQPAKEATVGLVTADRIWQNVAKKYSINKTDLDQLRKDYFAGEKLNRKFYSYVKNIRKNYQVALFTNAWDDGRDVYTHKYHLDKICDRMIISAEEGMRKPNKNFYYHALELLNVKPEEVIYVDDRTENIRTGRQLGFNSIQFNYTGHVIDQINALL